jgi:peptidyl-dipeptidase Dcp
MKNPLLEDFDLVPFASLKTEHFKPAFTEALELARQEIDAITQQSEPPTFTNTVESLDFAGYRLDRISSAFFNLNSAETSSEIQKLAQEISPLLTEFSNDITLNQILFERIRSVYEQRGNLNLNPEQTTLLERKFKHFSRNGALLDDISKNKLREIDTRLAKLKLTFGEHVLEETNIYAMHLTQKEDVAGLPDSALEAARARAVADGKEGWVITLDYPSYMPFMKYAQNRDRRKELALAFGSKGFHGDALDNREIVLEIAKLRHKRAQLLGYKTHAHFVLEERMAESPETVSKFLSDLLSKSMSAAQREFEELQEYAKKLDGIDRLESWDSAYYSEKLKQEKFELDDEILKPYFELNRVLNGVFTIAGTLFDLHFTKDEDLETYHKEVEAYRVTNSSGDLVAIFYADFHPRAGKRGGAWMTSFKSQFRKGSTNERPHISIVCNFSRATESAPALLTFNEVTTLFHEFGHALHGMLANTTYPSLSGTSVFWDFVELPSQIMENWCYEPEALRLFARHYKTDEIIPQTWIDKIKASSNFMEGMATVRQLSFGLLDMAWHGTNPESIKDVKSYESDAFNSTRLFPENPETCMSTSFSHIFQGGYSSGYYSYKWAEVLDADAFAYFKETGIFNRETAKLFRDEILSRGGTEDPMDLYIRFRGRKPELTALLERAGLLTES